MSDGVKKAAQLFEEWCARRPPKSEEGLLLEIYQLEQRLSMWRDAARTAGDHIKREYLGYR